MLLTCGSFVCYIKEIKKYTVNKSVPIGVELAQCWFPGLAISNAEIKDIYFFQIKYTEAI